jgi:glycine/D-amino acid oxidase-like deaminating enzyme
MDHVPPVLIVGQGLAGTALAWQLWDRRLPFLIVDRDEPLTSSKIAAGLITPITGMRWSLSPDFDSLLRESLGFYRQRQRLLHQHFLFSRPNVRLFTSEQQATLWQRRTGEPTIQPYIHPQPRDPLVSTAVFANDLGGVQIRHAAYLDTAAYLAASRLFFQTHHCWQQGEVSEQQVTLHRDHIEWRGSRYSHLIHCTGWQAMRSAWFDWVPFQPARGTILTIAADLLGEQRIINHGLWIVPQRDGSLRAGSTYETRFKEAHSADPSAVAALTAKLQLALRVPFTILETQTAVRPCVMGQYTLIGTHPVHPRLAFFNGLGSKGTLRAPHYARRLIDHLMAGAAIPESMDVQRNFA